MAERLVLDSGAGALVLEPGEREGELLAWVTPDDGRRVLLDPGLVMMLCAWLDNNRMRAAAELAFRASFEGGAS